MGLYNTIDDFEIDCPNCGKKIRDFQTKDSHQVIMSIVSTKEVDNFYSSCECGAWIEYRRKPFAPKKQEDRPIPPNDPIEYFEQQVTQLPKIKYD